ncbi:MAG: hypothetical protein ABEI58_03845 [Candidatus Nanohaloarchaea archaeon]
MIGQVNPRPKAECERCGDKMKKRLNHGRQITGLLYFFCDNDDCNKQGDIQASMHHTGRNFYRW